MKTLHLILFIFLAFLGGCEKLKIERHSYTVYNNSSQKIRVGVEVSIYPDTLLPKEIPILSGAIQPGKAQTFYEPNTWESIFRKAPSDTLSLFIFSADTLEKYSWQEVREGYKILRRVDFDLEYLRNNSHTFYYPVAK